MEEYWEWLCSITGLYRTQQELLLRCFGTPEHVCRATAQELAYIEKKGCRWAARVRNFQEQFPPEKVRNDRIASGIQFISCEHSLYPKRLTGLNDFPYGLFYRGSLPEETRGAAAVVGARMCTVRGKRTAERIAACIAQAGGQVISGAAYGIDGAAQWAALEAGGQSFAVLGCGADRSYPSSHEALLDRLAQCGGVISEFPPGTLPRRHHFPMRNRIISGLSDLVVVVEARRNSGSLITAEFAAEQGRTVLAVPGRMEDELSEGCNELIAQGADLILTVDDPVYRLFPDYRGGKKQRSENIALAPAEKLVYSSLGLHMRNLWELEEETSLSLEELGSSLLSLELKGLVRETERNYYTRVES